MALLGGTHFLRLLTAGLVTVTAVALNQGRSQQLWQVSITDTEGRLIAHWELRLQNIALAATKSPSTTGVSNEH